jgi:polysaccharide pyruvyl transferase WcaK-like protein
MQKQNTKYDVRRFLLLGNTNYSNLGCEAIARGTAAILRKTFGSETLIYLVYLDSVRASVKKEDFDAGILHLAVTETGYSKILNNIKSIFNPSIRRAMPILSDRYFKSILNKCDAVLMTGGDNFTFDYGKPDLFFKLNSYIRYKKKLYVIWGASIGPFSSDPEYEISAARHLKNVPLIITREKESQKYLSGINVTENVRYAADPAFLLEPKRPDVPTDILSAMEKGCIGINLSPLLSGYFGSRTNWVNTCVRAVELVYDLCKKPILLIPHVVEHPDKENNNDTVFLNDVKAQIKSCEIYSISGLYSAAEIKHIISRCLIFAGARTHSTIAAISSCVPTICIGYSTKARGISMDVYGSDKWLLEISKFTPESFSQLAVELLSRQSEISCYLSRVAEGLRVSAMKAGSYLAELLQK